MSVSETKTFSTHWRDYFEVTKPRVVALMVFTAIVGMLLAPSNTTVMLIVVASVGIGLMQARQQQLISWQISTQTQKCLEL